MTLFSSSSASRCVRLPVAVVGLLALGACNDDSNGDTANGAPDRAGETSDDGSASEADGDGNGPVADPAPGVRYLVSMGVPTPDDVTGLVYFLDSLDADADADPAEALEVPGGGFVFPVAGSSDFIVAESSEPILTRYAISDGSIEVVNEMSLKGIGISEGVRTVRVIDDNRGFIATNEGILVEFDPSGMTITRDIELDGILRDGYALFASTYGRSYVRGDSFFAGYGWWGEDSIGAPKAESALVHIDLATGEHSISYLEGCGDLDAGFVDDDGTLWLASGGYVAGYHAFLGDVAAPSCLVELPTGVTSLDGAKVSDLSELAGEPAGDLLPIGGGTALVRVLDPSGFDVSKVADVYELTGATAWAWATLDVDTKKVEPFDLLDLSTVPTSSFADGNDQIIAVTSEDFASTRLTRVTADGVTEGIELPGFFISAVAY